MCYVYFSSLLFAFVFFFHHGGDFNFYVVRYINLFFMAIGFCVCLFLSTIIYFFNDQFFSP